jgi:hypothetical protein
VTAKPQACTAIFVDVLNSRGDHCKVAIQDDLAIECRFAPPRFDSIVSNHVGLAAKLERKRVEEECEVVGPGDVGFINKKE